MTPIVSIVPSVHTTPSSIFIFVFGIGIGAAVLWCGTRIRKKFLSRKRLLVKAASSEAVIMIPDTPIHIGGPDCDLKIPGLQKPIVLASLTWPGKEPALLLTVVTGTIWIEGKRVGCSVVYRPGKEIAFRYEHRTYHFQLFIAGGQS